MDTVHDRSHLDGMTPPARSNRSRSRVSNGSALLPGVDGRSLWVRRCRDVIEAHISDLGGTENTSEAERSLVRRAAVLTTELERLETRFATAGEAKPDDIDLYSRVASNMRRLLEAVGLRRRARDLTPSLAEYLASRAVQPDRTDEFEEADPDPLTTTTPEPPQSPTGAIAEAEDSALQPLTDSERAAFLARLRRRPPARPTYAFEDEDAAPLMPPIPNPRLRAPQGVP